MSQRGLWYLFLINGILDRPHLCSVGSTAHVAVLGGDLFKIAKTKATMMGHSLGLQNVQGKHHIGL